MSFVSKGLAVLGAVATLTLATQARADDEDRYLVVKGPISAGFTINEQRGVRVLRPITENTLVMIDTQTGQTWSMTEGMLWQPVPFGGPADVPVSVFKPSLLNP
ncbi:MAG: hypothetical protein ACE5H8_08185 [Alphaproteobacteria bacterium]